MDKAESEETGTIKKLQFTTLDGKKFSLDFDITRQIEDLINLIVKERQIVNNGITLVFDGKKFNKACYKDKVSKMFENINQKQIESKLIVIVNPSVKREQVPQQELKQEPEQESEEKVDQQMRLSTTMGNMPMFQVTIPNSQSGEIITAENLRNIVMERLQGVGIDPSVLGRMAVNSDQILNQPSMEQNPFLDAFNFIQNSQEQRNTDTNRQDGSLSASEIMNILVEETQDPRSANTIRQILSRPEVIERLCSSRVNLLALLSHPFLRVQYALSIARLFDEMKKDEQRFCRIIGDNQLFERLCDQHLYDNNSEIQNFVGMPEVDQSTIDDLSDKEKEDIENIKNLGITNDESEIVRMYIFADKNIENAVNMLMNMKYQ